MKSPAHPIHETRALLDQLQGAIARLADRRAAPLPPTTKEMTVAQGPLISLSRQQAYVAERIRSMEEIKSMAKTGAVQDAAESELTMMRAIQKTLSTIIEDRAEQDYHASRQ